MSRKLIFALLLLVQIVFIFHLFRPSTILNNEPLYDVDYPFHYYNTYAARNFIAAGGHTWGYDPYFLAGYPCNVIADVDNKGMELFCLLSSYSFLPVMFKFGILLTFILSPLLMYWSARNFGLPKDESLCAYGIAIFLWNAARVPYLNLLKGLYAYTFTCFASIFVLSLMYAYLERTGP